MSAAFCYLPESDRYLNLAAVALVETIGGALYLDTIAPDCTDEGNSYRMRIFVKQPRDMAALRQALRQYTINTHEAPSAEKQL